MTRKCLLFFYALLALGPAWAASDIPLELVKHPAEHQGWLPGGSRSLRLLERPTGVRFPELHHCVPLFAEMTLGEGRFLVVVDCDGPGRPFYNRLMIDTNRNRDLTDDPVWIVDLDASLAKDSARPPALTFPPVDLMLPDGGRERPYRVRICVQAQWTSDFLPWTGPWTPIPGLDPAHPGRALTLLVQVACHLEGSFTLDGRRFRVALADWSATGYFGADPAPASGRSRRLRGDLLFFTKDESFSPHAAVLPGSRVLLDGALFDLSFDLKPAGPALRLRASTGDTPGRLRFPTRLQGLRLVRQGEERPIEVIDPGTAIRLPLGSYRLASYELRRQDDAGNWWTVQAAAPRSSASWFEVAAGAEAVLPMGEPFVGRVAVVRRFRSGVEELAVLSFSLMGAGGESVGSLTVLGSAESEYPLAEDRRRPKAPAFSAIQADGSVVATGSFRYG